MKRRQRALLVAILILLMLLLCGLTWLYVSLASPPRSASQTTPEGMEFERSLYLTSSEATGFSRPSRIGVAGNGDLIVTDSTPNSRVAVRVSQQGSVVGSFEPAAPFLKPSGVGVWADGQVWIADFGGAHVIIFDPEGNEVDRIPLVGASAINIVGDRAYVCTLGEVRVFNQAGEELQVYGLGRGAAEGQLDLPHGAVPAGDDLIVADSLNARLVKLTADGEFTWVNGGRAKDMNAAPTGDFQVPTDVIFGQDGFLFTLDAFNFEILVLDPESLDIVKRVGEAGSGDGQFMYPEGIAYLGGDRYAVADRGNARVQILKIPLPGATGGTVIERTRASLGSISRVMMCAAVFLLLLLLLMLAVLMRRRSRGGDVASALEAELDEQPE